MNVKVKFNFNKYSINFATDIIMNQHLKVEFCTPEGVAVLLENNFFLNA